jgi:CRP/FNR family transcriptional regulator, cyclic AMP receptor protein
MSEMPIMPGQGIAQLRAGSGPSPAGTLAGIAIFRELAPDAVASLSRRCRWRRYGPGQTILHRRDEGREVFFIVRGRVAAVHVSASGREIRLCELPAGELFGEFAAIDGEPRSTDVVSVTDTLVASMSAELFWEVLRRHEQACAAILRRLTRAVRAAQQRVVEFSILPVRGRLHAELLRLAQIGRPDPDHNTAVITPIPTHAEIASRISTHREAVTRELCELARARVIEKRGDALVIRDVAALVEMVEQTLEEPCGGPAAVNARRRRA